MNVVELYTLAKWVNREIVETELSAKYSNLHAILQQNVHHPSETLEEHKNDLIEAVKSIDLTTLTKVQTAFLNEIKILHALGTQGVEQIEYIWNHHGLDIITAVEKFLAIINDLNNGVNKLNSIFESLDGCIHDDSNKYKNEVLIRVSFQDDASMSNIKDFKDWADKWHLIGRGIAMAHNKKPEDIKIVGATRGSIVLDLIANPEIVATIGGIMLLVLEVTERVANIIAKAAEIRHIDTKDKELRKDVANLEKTAKKSKEAEITNIINLQITQLNLKDDNEKTSILKKSITTLVDFLEKGGGLELIAPEKTDDSDSKKNKRVEAKFAKIRKINTKIKNLENKMKLIEHKNSNEGEDEEGDADANEKDEPPE